MNRLIAILLFSSTSFFASAQEVISNSKVNANQSTSPASTELTNDEQSKNIQKQTAAKKLNAASNVRQTIIQNAKNENNSENKSTSKRVE